MKKRLLAWLLAVVMVVGLLPVVALADETDGTGIDSVNTGSIAEQSIDNTQQELSRLMFRYVKRNKNVWTEESGALNEISILKSVELNNSLGIRLYYGTSTTYNTVDSVASGNTDIVAVASEIASDGKSFFRLSGAKLGSANLTCLINGATVAEFTTTVGLPRQGFYSAADRKAEYYLSSLTLTGTDSDPDTIWYISTILEDKTAITVKEDDETITNIEWIDDYTLEIPLPTGITAGRYEISVYRSNGNNEPSKLRGITVSQSQSNGDQSGSEAEDNLPYYGFYSVAERTSENYLSEIALTGAETDLSKVWFVGKGALKNTETDVITVTAGGEDITSTCVNVVSDSTLVITLPTGITAGRYEISVYRSNGNNEPSKLRGIIVSQSQSGGGNQSGGFAAYIGDYVIGFAEKRADGEVTKICESAANIFGHGTIENTSPNVPYQKEVDICIAAAKKRADTTGTVIYEVDSTVTDSVVIKRLWLETLSGDNTTYSWSGDGLVTELTSVQEEPVPLYVKEGRNCEATVHAEIAVMVGEQTYEQTIRMNIGLVIIEFSGLTRPDDDTVEQLNAFLAELAGQINTTDSKNEIYDIKLGSTTYEGTIHVPAAFKRYQANLHFIGTGKNGKQTVVKGGLDINGAFIEYIRDIHFVADESSASQTRAIFGGGLRNVGNCTFYGYDIALDSSEGLINASNSVFVNNEIAALVNINGNMNRDNILPGDWNGNTFINNETVVQILSLAASVSPYYFRIYDSNFINNGTDIDAQCGGTLYMYRNYFGQYKEVDGHRPHPGKHHHDRHNGRDDLRLDDLLAARTESKLNGILEYARAKVSTENETKVITNPRWLHPVKGWWSHNALVNDTFFGSEPTSYALMTLDDEPEYKDVLVADWEDGTVILNEESNSLRLDASAFDSTAEKEIGVVDENETILGTWNFD